jgi:hypothetical protein
MVFMGNLGTALLQRSGECVVLMCRMSTRSAVSRLPKKSQDGCAEPSSGSSGQVAGLRWQRQNGKCSPALPVVRQRIMSLVTSWLKQGEWKT